MRDVGSSLPRRVVSRSFKRHTVVLIVATTMAIVASLGGSWGVALGQTAPPFQPPVIVMAPPTANPSAVTDLANMLPDPATPTAAPTSAPGAPPTATPAPTMTVPPLVSPTYVAMQPAGTSGALFAALPTATPVPPGATAAPAGTAVVFAPVADDPLGRSNEVRIPGVVGASSVTVQERTQDQLSSDQRSQIQSAAGDNAVSSIVEIDLAGANRQNGKLAEPVTLVFPVTPSEYLATVGADRAGHPERITRFALHDGEVLRLQCRWDGPEPGTSTCVTDELSTFFTVIVRQDQVAANVVKDVRYFQQTGFRVERDAFWDYFQKRGGVNTFGYPISREFMLQGFPVQFFQRAILQAMPNGGVARMNLMDEGLMPYTQINFSVFPKADKGLIDGAPAGNDADYAAKAMAFLKANVPDVWEGRQVGFLKTFMSTVKYEDAFPNRDGEPALVPLMNLELWGLPTSKPAPDPANGNFVYQRFQRGILHYDASTGATQGLLLGDYMKSIMTGKNLPIDLAEQAKGSKFFKQYDPAIRGSMTRPSDLAGTDLAGAFGNDVVRDIVTTEAAAAR